MLSGVMATPAYALTSLSDIVDDNLGVIASASISCFQGKITKGIQGIFGNGESSGSAVPSADDKVRATTDALENKESCIKVIERAAAQMILREITIATVNWINNGFNGNSLYVDDTSSVLKGIGDRAVKEFNSIGRAHV